MKIKKIKNPFRIRTKLSKKEIVKSKPVKKLVTNIIAKCTSNNTFISTKNFSISTGEVGFKGGKRSTPYAANQVAQFVGEKLSERSITFTLVTFKNFGKWRKAVLKGLIKKKIKILKVIDKSSNPHNGCRPSKKRRRRTR